ncbi:Tyrosine recombinase XerC [Rubrobacter xylanophilus DSM 9941]|uniref:site-specific integrase n=1 Tax=Rubrobacter xylanophilus TaxID=49319 RepID=UPI001C6405CA|nr:site-specific integrase [Rubrobacter xylanophilus]QYJ15172.1 Tyrosine recombinase XerC [Rubrobacter xylanophilus DSM 9941]
MARKKEQGNGTGTVYPRKNKAGKVIGYRGSYFTADGRRRYVSAKTKTEARRALRQAMADADRGLIFDAEGLKVGEYLDRWLADSVNGTVRTTTFERYEQITRVHLKPTLGQLKLKALTPAHVRGLYKEKLKTLSPRTVQYIHVTLHKALSQAVMDGLIPRNATEAVKPPQVRREEIRPLTPDQVKALLDAASGDRLEALYVLAVHTGLRQGELLALRWDDVDLESGTLQVRRTLSMTKDGPAFTAPKTAGSRRSVKLTNASAEALRGHLKRQLAEMDKAGSLWRAGEYDGLIFASETGMPLDRRDLTTRRFKPLLRRAGLPQIRFHDLRHTCATLLLSRNVNPKIVSEMLGHATIAITLDTYSHVLPNMRDTAAKALEEALS